MARRWAVVLLLMLLVSAGLPAASIVVPSLDFVTRGAMNGGVFGLASRGQFELQVAGGYKLGGSLSFEYDDTYIEEASPADGLGFKGLRVTVERALGLPLSLGWFIGEQDVLCSGVEFPQLFGTAPVASDYTGLIHFPTGILYDGIHEIKGTGVRVGLAPVNGRFALTTWLYQDGWFSTGGLFDAGRYSADVGFALSLEAIKLEAFVGASYVPTSVAGWYRGGLLFLATGPSVQFLAQVGIPKLDPFVDTDFGINLFYLLFEPRLHVGLFSLVPTFFWHPGYYHQAATGELGSFDINLDMGYGDLAVSLVQGGLETTMDYRSVSGIFEVKASPYVRFATAGAVWDIRVSARLWPFSLADMLEAFVGVQAEL